MGGVSVGGVSVGHAKMYLINVMLLTSFICSCSWEARDSSIPKIVTAYSKDNQAFYVLHTISLPNMHRTRSPEGGGGGPPAPGGGRGLRGAECDARSRGGSARSEELRYLEEST